MKFIKVLIICYDFPPLNTVGAHRVESWFKYLHKYGIYPTIVTRKWNIKIDTSNDYYTNETGGVEKTETPFSTVVRIPYQLNFFERLNQKLTSLNFIVLRKALTFLLSFVRWIPSVTTEKSFYVQEIGKHVDVSSHQLILVSGEPFILFKYAYELSNRYNIPYLLDYRDGFTTSIFKANNFLQQIVNKWERLFEKKYLQSAVQFVTVSTVISNEIEAAFGPKKYNIIENGVDLALFDSIPDQPINDFHIVYTGTLYMQHDVSSFLSAFETFIQKHPDEQISITFAGISYRPSSNSKLAESFQQKYPSHIQVLPPLSKKDSIALQKKAAVLLKFSSGAVVNGFYGAKLYEYVACNKPIVNVVAKPEHAVTDFFEDKKIQRLCCGEKEILSVLENCLMSFKENTLQKEYLTKDEIYRISRVYNTELLSNVIKQCVHTIHP